MEVFIVFSGIALIIGVIKYFNYKKQLLEQMAVNPNALKLEGKLTTGNDALRFGLLFIGIAAGTILGAFLNKIGLFTNELFGYITGIFLCGGFALIGGYIIENNKKK